jgi:hypothetical protein
MAIPRKKALERLAGLEEVVLYHLDDHIPATLLKSPQDIPHWRKEVNAFLDQMGALAGHVGERTGTEWRAIIAEMRRRLTNLLGDLS